MKVVDVEMYGAERRVTVYFNAEDRLDFRDLVRDLAREFRARVEMRQVGARDTTRVMDGIGPCGRQLCCSSHLRKFDPISVKMAKTQDMPLTDSRLLGNCGRLKCCLLYEFSTYQELRARLPRVNSPCEASCGGSGCMTGKVKSIRVLAQSVIVGFPDGTQAEVPLDQLTWEGRSHVQPRTWGAHEMAPHTPHAPRPGGAMALRERRSQSTGSRDGPPQHALSGGRRSSRQHFERRAAEVERGVAVEEVEGLELERSVLARQHRVVLGGGDVVERTVCQSTRSRLTMLSLSAT